MSKRFLGAVLVLLAALVVGAAPAAAKPPTTFDPAVEAQNFSITQQRQMIYDTPQYQSQLAADSATSTASALAAEAADPGRFFTNNLCWNLSNGCAGDIRLYNWGSAGYGLVKPVLFTARDGATLSGHVWETVAGPAKRPAVVITDGSVQADEDMYWYAAQALAKDGYVVLTFDPQGQGQSDTLGESPDTQEGVPAQSDGRPFYDGTEDALNFLLSTPSHPYEPVASCNTGTSHDAKQNLRVKQGFDAAYNPYWNMIDPNEVGLAGHSYGAAGVSYIAQFDPRVKAVVAWDNLGGPGPDDSQVPGGTGGSQTIGENPCPADPADRATVPITKPGLGISADYGLPPTPNTSLPDPLGKSLWSMNYSKAGIDSGELIIRGGSHLDFSFIPNQAFGASYYGPDLISWYTSAWFDKYLKKDPSADTRLLTNRWRTDMVEAKIDPNHDPNMFSFYYLSRLDIHLDSGKRFDCEDLRDGCPGMVDNDGYPGAYSYLAVDTSHDSHSACSLFGCPSATKPGCPAATGRLSDDQLGLLTLGMTRKRAREAYTISTTRGHRVMDFFCLAGSGVRAGYPSGGLLAKLAARERRSVRGRVVIGLTSNSHYALHGVRPGSRLSPVARRLRAGKPFHVGLNFWYLVPNGSSKGVLKVRRGRIQEIGIANKRLTSGRKLSARFLRSFS